VLDDHPDATVWGPDVVYAESSQVVRGELCFKLVRTTKIEGPVSAQDLTLARGKISALIFVTESEHQRSFNFRHQH